MKLAFLFAGQGAQAPGMGLSLYENSAAAKNLLNALEQVRPGTLATCFSGPKEELNQTLHTQPCLYAVDLATALALREQGFAPHMAAGFSLGEWPALAFAGAFSHTEGFLLVCERARLMAEAAEQHPGAMAALLLPIEQAEALCQQAGVWAVNYNAPGQTVAAGSLENIESLEALARSQGGRAIRLAVSGAFHCPFMEIPAQRLLQLLQKTQWQQPGIPVYANKTARPYQNNLPELLSGQTSSPVRWEQTVRQMGEAGADVFVELGPGKVLSGLLRRILPDVTILHVEDYPSLLETAEVLRTIR